MPTGIGIGEAVHSPSERFAACTVCFLLLGFALLAVKVSTIQGPELKPMLPIVTTTWALADLMTAFLLLSQFYVNGTTFLTALGAAYALSGLLTCPYVLAFPNLFYTGHMSIPEQQISIWLWSFWHAAFPAIVGISALWDPQLKLRTMSRTANRNALWFTVVATIAVAGIVTALVFGEKAALPRLVINGRFTFAWRNVVAPALVVLNSLGCVLLLRRGKNLTTLHLWLVVAMFTGVLDCVLNAMSPSRYSYGWYIGKLETVVTANIVLGVLLGEVTRLYRHLADLANIDALTGLFNRRAFEEHIGLVFRLAKRESSELALLVIDVDLFKGYNDAYGHARGDECLRQIAAILKSSATRPLDHVARYGGEEFVVILPRVQREGTIAVAQRMLERVREACIPYASYARGHVTVSVGVGFVGNARMTHERALFDIADNALYEAKARGRDTYVARDYVTALAKLPLPEHASAS